MKKAYKGLFTLLLFVLAVPVLSAQSLKGLSLNGAAGLYTIPSGRIGWERSSNFGLDLGYHAVFADPANHIAKINMSLFKWAEISGAFDFQPDHSSVSSDYEPNNDFILGVKVQLPVTNTAVAVGGNVQFIDMGNKSGNYNRTVGQIYLAATYPGSFFKMPSETTVTIGYTFREYNNSNINFGMGFDRLLFPNIMDRYVHWLVDFSNYSYSDDARGAEAEWRGCLNTGIRIDLGAIPALNKFKFVLDVILVDAFDQNRTFSVGAVFGFAIL